MIPEEDEQQDKITDRELYDTRSDECIESDGEGIVTQEEDEEDE